MFCKFLVFICMLEGFVFFPCKPLHPVYGHCINHVLHRSTFLALSAIIVHCFAHHGYQVTATPSICTINHSSCSAFFLAKVWFLLSAVFCSQSRFFFAANLRFFCSQSRVFCSQSRVGNSTGGQHYYLPKYQTCHSTRIKSELQIHFVVFFSFAFEMWLPGACKGCQEPRKRQNSEVLVNIYFQLIINVHHRTFALFIFYYFLFFLKIILSLIVAICANKIRVFLFFYISSWSSLGLLDILLLGSISAGGSSSTSSSYLETWQLFLPPMCLQRGSDKGDESNEQEGDQRKLKAVTCIRDPLVERSAVRSVMPFTYPFGWGLRTSNEEWSREGMKEEVENLT